MPVIKGSYYTKLKAFLYRDVNGKGRKCLELSRFSTVEDLAGRYTLRAYRPGVDWLDQLAYDFSGAEKHWRLIAQINNIADPLSIPEGTILKIPTMEEFRRLEGL